jgi:hypothetical protein
MLSLFAYSSVSLEAGPSVRLSMGGSVDHLEEIPTRAVHDSAQRHPSVYVMLCYGAPSTPVSAVFASRWPRVSASERHSVELQRHHAMILKRRLSFEQAMSFDIIKFKTHLRHLPIIHLLTNLPIILRAGDTLTN